MAAENRERLAMLLGCGIAVAFILVAVLARYSDNPPSMHSMYENILEKKKILEHLRLDLLKSVEMEKSAVMALTDEESLRYADQSRAAAARVDTSLAALRPLIDARTMPTEQTLLEEFSGCWTELSGIDRILLPLAVANTNLKAAKLSRDKGTASVQRFEQALESLRLAATGKANEQQIAIEISRALIAALKLFNLHGPHIAEADDSTMDQLEARMHAEQEVAHSSLVALGALFGREEVAITRAKAAFAEFLAITTQVVHLSRQNSNVKSMEISMGRKRLLAATCDEALDALQETMVKRLSKATK